MLSKTGIHWATHVWNPFSGCDQISPGCKNCYAEIMSSRLQKMGKDKYKNGFDFTVHPENYNDPSQVKKPCRIFVNSMGEIFHKLAKYSDIDAVFNTMYLANWHEYLILTKRAEIMQDYVIDWLLRKKEQCLTKNIWLGVSVENQDYVSRIDILKTIPARVKFVSYEPAIGPIDYNFTGIDWLIIGGESGHNHRRFDPQWARDAIKQARKSNTKIFFKQIGGQTPNAGGNKLDDEEILEYPVIAN